MPIKTKYATEALEPERIREAGERVRRAKFLDHEDEDSAGQFDHSIEEPSWRLTAMKGKIGYPRPLHIRITSFFAYSELLGESNFLPKIVAYCKGQ